MDGIWLVTDVCLLPSTDIHPLFMGVYHLLRLASVALHITHSHMSIVSQLSDIFSKIYILLLLSTYMTSSLNIITQYLLH